MRTICLALAAAAALHMAPAARADALDDIIAAYPLEAVPAGSTDLLAPGATLVTSPSGTYIVTGSRSVQRDAHGEWVPTGPLPTQMAGVLLVRRDGGHDVLTLLREPATLQPRP